MSRGLLRDVAGGISWAGARLFRGAPKTAELPLNTALDDYFLCFNCWFLYRSVLSIHKMSYKFANRRKPRKIGGDDEENDEGGAQGQ